MFPPDPLHINYLGPVNDALELLEKMYPIEMCEEFYVKHNMKKSGQGPGGKFNGPSIKYLLKEKALLDLEATLPTFSVAKDFTDYLRCIREVHKVCTSKTLDLKEAKQVVKNFETKFYNLYMEYNLSMTLKCHIIIHHYLYFFEKGGKTMKYTNGEFPESCHSTLRQSEELHGFKVKRNLGSPMHQQKSWQSLTLYNSKRAGHVTPLRLKKKCTPPSSSPSISPSSSPYSNPFCKRFLEKHPEALLNHNLINKNI